MKLQLLTPQGTRLIEQIKAITLPTLKGEITVLENHESLIVQLASGTIEVQPASSKKEYFASFEGFAQVDNNEVKVFSAGTEQASSLDEAKIQEAIKKAHELKEVQQGDIEFAAAAAQLERELARLKTIRRHKNRQL